MATKKTTKKSVAAPVSAQPVETKKEKELAKQVDDLKTRNQGLEVKLRGAEGLLKKSNKLLNIRKEEHVESLAGFEAILKVLSPAAFRELAVKAAEFDELQEESDDFFSEIISKMPEKLVDALPDAIKGNGVLMVTTEGCDCEPCSRAKQIMEGLKAKNDGKGDSDDKP